MRSNVLFSDSFIVYLAIAWLAGSLIAGAALAGLAKRIHQSLSFTKNWLFFSALMAVAMAALFGAVLL